MDAKLYPGSSEGTWRYAGSMYQSKAPETGHRQISELRNKDPLQGTLGVNPKRLQGVQRIREKAWTDVNAHWNNGSFSMYM